MSGIWSPGGPSNGADTFTGTTGADSADGLGGNDLLLGQEGADTINAGQGNNTVGGGPDPDNITAGDGADSIDGGSGNDTINAGGGNDTVFGGSDLDSIDAGTGADSVSGWSDDDTIIATGDDVADTLDGGTGRDSILAGGGADRLFGAEGNDTIDAGNGNDTVDGGTGDDRITGGEGADSLVDGGGRDTINAGNGADTVLGGVGNQSILGGDGDDSLDGSHNNDTVIAGDGNDTVTAGLGNDIVDGGVGIDVLQFNTFNGVRLDLQAGTAIHGAETTTFTGFERFAGTATSNAADTLLGSADGDTLDGGGGNDSIDGREGDDSLIGSGGADTLDGGNGADTIDGGSESDRLIGGGGNDSFIGGSGTDAADYSANTAGQGINLTGTANLAGSGSDGLGGADSFTGIEVIFGGAGADTMNVAVFTSAATLVGNAGDDRLTGGAGADSLVGGEGADSLVGGNGADTLLGGNGDDSLDGGNGNDIASYSDASAGVLVDLNTANQTTGGAGNDTLANIENLVGSAFADTLTGGSGANTLIAGGGDDRVSDGGGSNSLDGGAGTDRLTFSTAGFYSIARSGETGPLSIRFLGSDSASAGSSTSTAVNFEEFTYNRGTFNLTAPGWDGTDILYVCFAAGTRILTATGEVPVEQLQPGDRVVTLAGRGLPVKPVLWVGRRHVVLAGRADAAEMAPIRIKAGALGPNVPQRDLLVSPDHCLHLDGALVPARLLVNGQSVVAEIGMAEVTWYHVELETHEVLVAEGAAAESWLDCGNRAWFQNAPVAMLTVPGNLDAVGTGWDATRACAPLVHGGDQLARIRAALDDRAEELAAPQPARMAL